LPRVLLEKILQQPKQLRMCGMQRPGIFEKHLAGHGKKFSFI